MAAVARVVLLYGLFISYSNSVAGHGCRVIRTDKEDFGAAVKLKFH